MNDRQMRYLTIGEVSEAAGLTSHTLRYYEEAGLMAAVFRDEHGRRRYAATAVEWVRMLRRLRDLGMTISEVRRFTALLLDKEAPASARLALLQAHRNKAHVQLQGLQATLDILDAKLDAYRESSPLMTPHQQVLRAGLPPVLGHGKGS